MRSLAHAKLFSSQAQHLPGEVNVWWARQGSNL
jgi:hypothetical protein